MNIFFKDSIIVFCVYMRSDLYAVTYYSSVGIAAAPPTSSTEAIHHFWLLFGTLSGWGSTVMISHCASVVGFQLLVFIFSQIQQDDCSAAWPILCAAVLLQHPVYTPNAEKTVLGILYNQPLLASSRSANPCLCTLSSTLHIWPSSARLLRHISLPRGQSTRWWRFSSSLPTTKPCPVLSLLVQSLGISAFCPALLLAASP